MEIIGYISLLFMGITLGLVGAGGSILTIPILTYLFKIPIILATTYSLVIVGLSAFLAVIRYRHHVLFAKAIIFIIPSVTGVFTARSYIIPYLINFLSTSLDRTLIILLLILMISAGYFMIKSYKLPTSTNSESPFENQLKIIFLSYVLGIIMGVLGTGGGFLIIPILVIIMRFNMREAIPTSLFIITINSIIGFISDKSHFYESDWVNLLKYLSFAITGMFIGIYLGKFISGDKLKKAFGYFISVIAFLIFSKEFIL